MQLADTTTPLSMPVEVLGPSLPLDLSWCVHAAHSESLREAHPALGRLYAEHGDLLRRVLTFWPDGMPCLSEAQVIAHHAGALGVTDFPTFRTRAETTLGSISLDLELASETSEERSGIIARLAALQRSAELRRKYFDLLSEVWSLVAPWWESEGAPVVERTAADVRRTLGRGVKWHQIVTTECPSSFLEHLPEIIARSELGYPVVLAPCAFFGKGLYLELPGCILIGFGVQGAVQVARARTEQVVRPLRALADPTRLAIFGYLKGGPAAVGDIADAFFLSQPTVSVHVKRLREAGLVTAERRGNRLEISIDETVTGSLATDLAALLSG
jgi:ArsR family transcriptional regulator, arsenate/arsenite/antimonite-responsive transcriptional repressor